MDKNIYLFLFAILFITYNIILVETLYLSN